MPNTPSPRPDVEGIAGKMRNLTESIGNFMGRINPTKLCAADDQQYVAASGALDILEYLADKVEALEACQAGFRAEGVQWSDISRGMHREPRSTDELQMRGFWRRWHGHMMGADQVRTADRMAPVKDMATAS